MPQEFAHPEAIVSTAWVAERLGDPSVVVAEIDSHLDEAYETGHVPGAVGWGLHTDMEHQLRRDIPGHGAVRGSDVAFGHRAGYDGGAVRRREQPLGDVGLLGDEILRARRRPHHGRWKDDVGAGGQAGLRWWSLWLSLPNYRAGGAPDPGLRAMKEYVAESLDRTGVALLDTRSIEEYVGELTSAPGTPQPDIYRKGRIPGAVHVAWDDGAASRRGVQVRR